MLPPSAIALIYGSACLTVAALSSLLGGGVLQVSPPSLTQPHLRKELHCGHGTEARGGGPTFPTSLILSAATWLVAVGGGRLGAVAWRGDQNLSGQRECGIFASHTGERGRNGEYCPPL